ncbi:MAG: proton-conducting transporter membrane subunit, partial [Ignavibacteria bacterium]
IGIAPIHAWLPDAHSEAPSPVSALLSGTLLNTAFLGLIRVQGIFVQAHMEYFSNFLFMVTGFLSLMISSVFILNIKNYKRMLAYSSIENMGILFIGISLGKLGIFAVLIHTLAHSLSKTSLFLTSGNILHLYKSKKINDVSGLLKKDSATGWLWIISTLSIIGIPPFPIFLSKFLIIKAFWLSGNIWLVIPFFLFMLIVAFGMGKAVFNMAFGNSIEQSQNSKHPFYAYAPQFVLLLILLVIGINIPPQVLAVINSIADFFN